MEKKRKIVQYRERLDKTLASPDLTNEDILKTLVKKQLLQSSEGEIEGNKEEVTETRTSEVSEFLDMLRSASIDDSKKSTASHTDWKLKQDSEEFRVMYREGPEGTPFHTLLVEGYVDGPIDVCLCLSWETPLYKKWWPQTTVPSFKILLSDYLQKVQIGEQISIVRVNCWPLTTREAVVHYYLFEYFQDDLIVVLLKTVPEPKSINGTIHGFNNEPIPEAKDAVRIDLVGGFALQKITSERSYFRTIANMDIKLDFVPPSLINFVSRQLIGSGFKLYQKAVSSKMNLDTTFSKALGDPMYARIREALYDSSGSKRAMDGEEFTLLPTEDLFDSKQDEIKSNKNSTEINAGVLSNGKAFGEIEEADSDVSLEELQQGVIILSDKDLGESKLDEARDVSQEGKSDQYANKSTPMDAIRLNNRKVFGEIVEADSEEIVHFEEDDKRVNDIPIEEIDARSPPKAKRNVRISSEVEQALQTLEKAISVVRKYGFISHRSSSSFDNEGPLFMENGEKVDSLAPKFGQVYSKGEVSFEVPNKDIIEGTSQEAPGTNSDIRSSRLAVTNPDSKEVDYNKVVPTSPEHKFSRPNEASQVSSLTNKVIETPAMEQNNLGDKQLEASSDEPKMSKRWKKYQYCCILPQLWLRAEDEKKVSYSEAASS
ncbi:hypothetical protein L6164_009526 [Bauhinia variegata]|uniref:Uncharacterized protein n=1 Tax=Bauhinia variegata TaxID=167791 RepID=A0ACB9PMX3_BAUVA|nr:hypothetical protein L6164_009526 [Bauhinia variegata]